MRLAHIVPPKAIPHVMDLLGPYHLLLPHLVYQSHGYRKHYAERNDYKILDNGIAEGKTSDFAFLRSMAKAMDAQELVLPDAIKNADKTLEQTAQVFYQAFNERQRLKFMFVVQGTHVQEAYHCAEEALNLFPGLITSFGVPRHLLDEGEDSRAKLVGALRNLSPNRPIHLLGMHPQYTTELFDYMGTWRKYGIRGCDTSLAWNLARSGDLVKDTMTKKVPRQSIESFAQVVPTDAEADLLRENIRRMNAWVK